jgi:dTDP-4-dehydrorhamnose reductase
MRWDLHCKRRKSLTNNNLQVKKILLTGVNGQVGHALASKLVQHNVIALTRAQLDLTKLDDIRRVVSEIKPDIIINPAGYTAVDQAESESELCYAVNATAVQVLAEEAAKVNAGLIHFSTDYVFAGDKQNAYVEDDFVEPINVYGKSKLAGELAIQSVGLPHIILRSSWIYSSYGNNFFKTILRLAQTQENMQIVADQRGAPSSSQCIADGVVHLLSSWQPNQLTQSGVYHFTNIGETTWHGFACEIINQYNNLQVQQNWPELNTKLENIAAVSSADYPRAAHRPANSRLDNNKIKQTFNIELPSWQQGLKQVMQTLVL